MSFTDHNNSQEYLSVKILALVGFFAAVWWLSLETQRWLQRRRNSSRYPVAKLNGQTPLESWLNNGTQLVEEAMNEFEGPFQLQTGTGLKVVIRNRCAEEFAKSPTLSVAEALRLDSFAEYPGFEAAKVSLHGSIIQTTLLRRLTPALDGLRTQLLADVKESIQENFGRGSAWKTTPIQPLILDVVTKVSSRPFAGDRLCRNPKWLDIQKQYAGLSSTAASELRKVAGFLRPVRHWFLPECVRLRELVREARRLYSIEMQARREDREETVYHDAIQWTQDESRRSSVEVDVVAAQLQLSMVAIQTTSHILCQALQHICEHKQFLIPLRDEIKSVSQDGWSKATLYRLRVMDDFMKESLRISQGRLAMARVATETTAFSDGSMIPKGTGCVVEGNFHDAAVYPDPNTFDPTRFSRMREQDGRSQSWQYVSTSSKDLGFGYGIHSCPGRFFAANVVKIAFAELLMQYDWSSSLGDDSTSDQEMRISFRHRGE